MHLTRRSLGMILAAALWAAPALALAGGSQSVWSGLVIASNVAQPAPVPPELNGIEGELKGVFGYNQFQIIGQAKKVLRSGEEDWLAKSKYFALKVDSKSSTATGYQLNLQLFKEQELLLETEAKLAKSNPLVIKGPQVGDGQLLLVLVVM